jgi:hypothetical protein
MKDSQIAAALLQLSAAIALTEDFKTINGKQYKDATVNRVEQIQPLLCYSWLVGMEFQHCI